MNKTGRLLFIVFGLAILLVPNKLFAQSADCDGVVCVVGGDLQFDEQFIYDAREVGIVLSPRRETVVRVPGVDQTEYDRGTSSLSQQQASSGGGAGGQTGGSGGQGAEGLGASGGAGSGGMSGVSGASFNDPSRYDNDKPKISIPAETKSKFSATSSGSAASTVKPLLDLNKSGQTASGAKDSSNDSGTAKSSPTYGDSPAGKGAGGDTEKSLGKVDAGSNEFVASTKIWNGYHNGGPNAGGVQGALTEEKEKPAAIADKEKGKKKSRAKSAKDLLRERWEGAKGGRSISSVTPEGFGPKNVFIFSGMCSHYDRFESSNGIDEGKTPCPPEK